MPSKPLPAIPIASPSRPPAAVARRRSACRRRGAARRAPGSWRIAAGITVTPGAQAPVSQSNGPLRSTTPARLAPMIAGVISRGSTRTEIPLSSKRLREEAGLDVGRRVVGAVDELGPAGDPVGDLGRVGRVARVERGEDPVALGDVEVGLDRRDRAESGAEQAGREGRHRLEIGRRRRPESSSATITRGEASCACDVAGSSRATAKVSPR